MINQDVAVSLATFHRMPIYLRCLYVMKQEGKEYVSSVALAEAAFENASVVKKDLSYVISNEGRPKIGYGIDEVIDDIESFLGFNNTKDAVLIGAGKLGQALMGYRGFAELGLNIIAGFDIDDNVVGSKVNGKKILATSKLKSAIEKLNVKMAILTVPAEHAQEMTDLSVQAGIRAIWNFTPAHLKVPESVALKNENMASSLAVLSGQLKEILRKETK